MDEMSSEAATYRTKNVTFLGRQVPIVLQNGNGPCPLIAICNVLLLRNNISLPSDSSEVSLATLLDILGAALVDSSSNEQNEDRINKLLDNKLGDLHKGLDVDVRFHDIHDVEFPKGCAIFDLLNIDIVHGWLCDPQDDLTCKALGGRSYNDLSYNVVKLRSEPDKNVNASLEDDEVDFAAATTATLGVPSPSRKSLEGLHFPPNEMENHIFPEQAANSWSEVEGPTTTDIENGFVSVSASDWRDRASDSEQLTSTPGDAQSLTGADFGKQTRGTDGAESTSSIRSDFESFPADNNVDTVGAEQSIAVQSFVETCHNLELSSENCEPGKTDDGTQKIAEEQTDSGKNVEELLYEGESSLQSSYEKEPLYEGEGVLLNSGCQDPAVKAELIEEFLTNHASQLTYHGLFSLQERLKNGELCVFFRNNHFSTMFKYNGGLFLLVTDQGYISEPHVVWEKLTEVDGDSVFFNGDFELFKVDDTPSSGSWNERDAVAATADYISQINTSKMQPDPNDVSSYSSDLQLAMALQQQEFDQQQQQPPQQHEERQEQQQQQRDSPRRQQAPSPRKHQGGPRPSSSSSSSLSTGRLFTGGRSSSPPSPKPDAKGKDKCRRTKENKRRKSFFGENMLGTMPSYFDFFGEHNPRKPESEMRQLRGAACDNYEDLRGAGCDNYEELSCLSYLELGRRRRGCVTLHNLAGPAHEKLAEVPLDEVAEDPPALDGLEQDHPNLTYHSRSLQLQLAFSKMGNSALKRVHTVCSISSLEPGSWPPN